MEESRKGMEYDVAPSSKLNQLNHAFDKGNP